MEATTGAIIGAVLSSIVVLIIKGIVDWASNKSTKKEFETLKNEYDEKFRKVKKEYDEKLNKMEDDFDEKLTSTLSYIKDVKNSIDEQRREFAELKETILTSYVNQQTFEKHKERFEKVRDTVMTHHNNIEMIQDSCRQNVNRMTQFETRLNK